MTTTPILEVLTMADESKSLLRNPSRRVAVAAARARLAAQKKMGVESDPRLVELANLPKAS